MTKIEHTLQQRLERARQLRQQGYTCSQCVVMVFDDVTGMDAPTAAAASLGLGGGVGGQHQVCGTVSGMALVSGFAAGGDPAAKVVVYSAIKMRSSQFRLANGSIVCAELLADKERRKPCMQYIEDSITILHNSLVAND